MTTKIIASYKPRSFRRSVRTTASWLPITIVLTAATGLFLYQLGYEGLWLDELNSVRDIDMTLPEVYKANQVRPLYYLLLFFWSQFGESDAWLRSLSVVFAIASVFLLYRLGRRLLGETEGLIAATMLALSPEFIHHAQEIRMYAVSLCLGLAGTLFLSDALLAERYQTPKQQTLAGWALFRLLAIYTVPLNVTLLLPDALIVFSRFRRQSAVLMNFAKWTLLIFTLWAPSVLSVVEASSPSSNYANDHIGATPPGPDRLIRPLKFLTAWPFPVQSNKAIALFYKLFTLLVAGLIGAGLIRKQKSPVLLWTFAWLLIPLLPIVAFSYMLIPIWQTRYLVFVSPYLFILLAAGLTRLWRDWKPTAIAIAAIYSFAVSGGLVHYYTMQQRPDYKFNVATIEQYEQSGDAIVWSYECCSSGLRRYYNGNQDVHELSTHQVKTEEDIQQWINQLPSGYERLWLVLGTSEPIGEQIERWAASRYTLERSYNYERGSKVLLVSNR